MPEDEITIHDSLDDADRVPLVQYEITSYGADLDVHGLVRRINKASITIPDFQRGYVWRIAEASRFIESLLLGLPVPGIFLAKEQATENLLVLDGQQRLKTLQFYYGGYFDPKVGDKQQKVFRLVGVQGEFEGKGYDELSPDHKTKLDDSIIHATIVKQNSPDGDNTSIYHIFERLNSEGRKLTEQEIRCAVYYGPLIDLISEINTDSTWRAIYGKESNRQKDKELILRFLALRHHLSDYRRPMSEYLNKFAIKYRNINAQTCGVFKKQFIESVAAIYQALGESAFRPERNFNAAVFDSVMIAVSRIIESGVLDVDKIKRNYSGLIINRDYINSVSKSTADESLVAQRISLAESLLRQ